MPYFINLFGESLRYWICDLPQETYDFMLKYKEEKEKSWEELFFDFDFLNTFGFNHWSELTSHPEQRGFLITKNNRIEVKGKTKKVLKLNANELLSQNTLFPLYQVTMLESNLPLNEFKRIVLLNYEIGQFAKYSFESDSFEVDKLDFLVHKFPYSNADFLLVNIKYKDVELKMLEEDTLVKKMQVIELS
ncbi:MAG: hypothetical protein FGM14_09170 [Flavobacteriales bacterium]|nr:hypothetical protein [Flavobacteriales bacterium]